MNATVVYQYGTLEISARRHAVIESPCGQAFRIVKVFGTAYEAACAYHTLVALQADRLADRAKAARNCWPVGSFPTGL